jgi:hypothetical protein
MRAALFCAFLLLSPQLHAGEVTCYSSGKIIYHQHSNEIYGDYFPFVVVRHNHQADIITADCVVTFVDPKKKK